MSLQGIQLAGITELTLASIIENETPENIYLEYKRDFPEKNTELVASISSFANTRGGDLILGISSDEDGIPQEVCGLQSCGIDEAKQKIENVLRDGVEPRLQVSLKEISLSDGSYAIVVRIPRSWNAPIGAPSEKKGDICLRQTDVVRGLLV